MPELGRTADGEPVEVDIAARKHRICKRCNKEFYVKWARELGRFCSQKCHFASKVTLPETPPIPCERCGTVFARRRKYPQQRFCSNNCSIKACRSPDFNARVARATIAERADRMRGTGSGRSYIKRNGQHEHRLIMEQLIGRPLQEGEIVHHRDGDKRNNSPDNLEITTRAEHAKIHNIGKVRPRRPGGSSAFKGVGRAGENWRACVGSRGSGTFQNLGIFTTEVAAAKAYDAVAKVLYGKNAILNFGPDND